MHVYAPASKSSDKRIKRLCNDISHVTDGEKTNYVVLMVEFNAKYKE